MDHGRYGGVHFLFLGRCQSAVLVGLHQQPSLRSKPVGGSCLIEAKRQCRSAAIPTLDTHSPSSEHFLLALSPLFLSRPLSLSLHLWLSVVVLPWLSFLSFRCVKRRLNGPARIKPCWRVARRNDASHVVELSPVGQIVATGQVEQCQAERACPAQLDEPKKHCRTHGSKTTNNEKPGLPSFRCRSEAVRCRRCHCRRSQSH